MSNDSFIYFSPTDSEMLRCYDQMNEDTGELDNNRQMGLQVAVRSFCNETTPSPGEAVYVEGKYYSVRKGNQRDESLTEACGDALPAARSAESSLLSWADRTPRSSETSRLQLPQSDDAWDPNNGNRLGDDIVDVGHLNFKDSFNNNIVNCCAHRDTDEPGVSGINAGVIPRDVYRRDKKQIGHLNIKNPDRAGLEQPTGAYGIRNPIQAAKSAISSKGQKVQENKIIKVTRQKPGKQFFVTLSLTFVPNANTRLLFLNTLHNPDNQLVSYCVLIEKSITSEQCDFHLHSYLQFEEYIYITELCEYLRNNFDGMKLDVQPCRSRRSCLKYISKEDTDLLTNIKHTDLHFNYQCYIWALNTRKYDTTDPFVVQHRFCYKFLERYFLTFQKEILSILLASVNMKELFMKTGAEILYIGGIKW